MKKVFFTCSIFLLIIGVVAFTLNIALGQHTSIFIDGTRQTTSGFNMWHFNFKDYIRNINLSLTEITYLQLELPNMDWREVNGRDFLEDLIYDLGIILNVIIFAINILIYPIRIGAYILRNALAIVGINQDTTDIKNGLSWLVELTEWLMARIQIPYVNSYLPNV